MSVQFFFFFCLIKLNFEDDLFNDFIEYSNFFKFKINLNFNLINLKDFSKKKRFQQLFWKSVYTSRKVFIFSDSRCIHLKNIRNWLFQNKTLIVNLKITYNQSLINNQVNNEYYELNFNSVQVYFFFFFFDH